MFGKDKKVMQKNVEQKKTFAYELDGVTFNVTLRVDVKRELVAMKEILKVAIEDIDKELAVLDEKK